MEGHRYADDSERGWYTGAQYNRAGSPPEGAHSAGNPYDSGVYDSGVQERPSGAFRLPEQRLYEAQADPLATTGSHARPAEAAMPAPYEQGPAPYESGRITARGPEYPTIRPTGGPLVVEEPAAQAVRNSQEVPTGLVPPVTLPRASQPVFRTRRPVSFFVVAAVMVVLLLPVVRLLLDATFSRTASAHAIVPAVLLTLGFTLSGAGLLAVAGSGTVTRESWLRPPVVYLPAGLVLLIAAGLAAA